MVIVIVIVIVVCAVVLVGGAMALRGRSHVRSAPRLRAPRLRAPRLSAPRLRVPRLRAPRLRAPRLRAPRPRTAGGPSAAVPAGEAVSEIEAPAEADLLAEAPAEADLLAEALVEAPSFRSRLGKARSLLSGYVGGVLSRGKIDGATWDDLEEALIRVDVGVATTGALLAALREQVEAERMNDPLQLTVALKARLADEVLAGDRTLHFEPGVPNVWLFVGVNGVGKTTTIGKVARHQVVEEGRSVVMAAGDTFRAAAADQLELWAKRVGADLVRGAEGGDPSAVVFDAVQRAVARGHDLVLADTAGRLHTRTNLMEELKKIRRVAERPPAKVTEVLLVLDATTGQNGLTQAIEFTRAVGVTGVVLTKLDGTARGGIVLAVQRDLGLPVKLVGLGEGAADLVAFEPTAFIEALFA